MARSPGHSAIPPPDKSFANALARVNIASQSTLLKRDGPSYVSFYKACSSSRLLKRQGIAVDWVLMSDIGEVLKGIVDAQAFPDYAILKNLPDEKEQPKR